MIYVLRKNKTLDFICFDKTIDGLKKKIDRCYWNAKGISSSGSKYTKEDYMLDKVISVINISDLGTSQLSDNSDYMKCPLCKGMGTMPKADESKDLTLPTCDL